MGPDPFRVSSSRPLYASIRSVMLYRLIPIVDRLCIIADVAGVIIPNAPSNISIELSVMINL